VIKKSDDPYSKVDAGIERINARDLKAMPLSLLRIGGKLYAQGTFPTKDGQSKKQTKIAIDLNAHVDFLYAAKQKALEIGTDLMLGKWEWPKKSNPIDRPVTVAEFMERHKKQYLDKNGNTPDTEMYWRKEYYYCFNKLPLDKPPSIDTCRRIIEDFKPKTRARTRHALAYCQLLKLAGIDNSELARLKSNYNPAAVQPRDIPTIEQIRDCYYNLNPEWRFFYFLLACFGLRGTEAHPNNLRLDDLHNGEIYTYGGKTGKWRYVPYCDRALFEELNCEPSWYRTDWTPLKLSDAFGSMLPHFNVQFPACALRHHYAYYALLQGWDTAIAARYMGHDIQTHCNIYLLCINSIREREIRRQREARQTLPSPPSPDRTLDN
jgi:integrase